MTQPARQQAENALFDPRLKAAMLFAPHPYAELQAAKAFPEGAVPEKAYEQLCARYAAVDDVRIQRIVYESDGLAVTGLMATPVGWKEQGHPVVIYNRGGNREFGRLTVINVMRMLAPLAQTGYIVLASNYRGNDGGEGQEEFGGVDVNDVITLLDIGRHHPGWDGQNAYMIGHSRGGMMTYLALKHSAEVNAAITIAAPTDIAKSEQQRPEMKKIHDALLPEGEAGRLNALKERSAIHWVDKIHVPLLILHGDKDNRVDVSHSKELAQRLAQKKIPHALVIYPGGGHALLSQWEDVLEKTKEWLESHRVNGKGDAA